VRATQSRAVLWRAAADALAATLWYVGQALGEENRAAAEAAQVLGDGSGALPPYIGAANFRELNLPDGRRQLTRVRNACCFYYTIAPASPCRTCPRLSDAERVRRVADEGPAPTSCNSNSRSRYHEEPGPSGPFAI